MIKKMMKFGFAICALSTMMIYAPIQSRAETSNSEYIVKANEIITETIYNIKIQRDGVVARKEASENATISSKVDKNRILEVKEKLSGDWVKVDLDGEEAYIQLKDGQGVIYETTKDVVDEETRLRQSIIDYAISFEGGKYVWGGVNPHFGVDCSGFTRYIMANVIRKNLPHSSRAQAGLGKQVSKEAMRPGDLIFYAEGSNINHVGIYIGKDKVISASTEKTGIKINRYDYRTPVKFVSMF